ncbi:MAG: hypothetical protein WBX11_10120 [Thiobacillaceae bacterium]|jgi:hypothetical protein
MDSRKQSCTGQMLNIRLLPVGERGHENRSPGSAAAIARLTSAQIEVIHVNDGLGWILAWPLVELPRRHSRAKSDLIPAAGHDARLPLPAAHPAFAGKAIALLRPSLRPILLDEIVLPRHVGLTANGNNNPASRSPSTNSGRQIDSLARYSGASKING